MAQWSAPPRPAEYAERTLVTAFLDGTYPAGAPLPGERELAAQLGITRPTLREALQRLERDGWLRIRQGKSTTVNDFWRDGGLNVLNALVRNGGPLPSTFVPHLLEVRLSMAPAYARAAVEHDAAAVVTLLGSAPTLSHDENAFAAYDWTLHRLLAFTSGNPVYTLILNGFSGFYEDMARLYFALPTARENSAHFYADLRSAAGAGDGPRAEAIVRDVMRASIRLWNDACGGPGA